MALPVDYLFFKYGYFLLCGFCFGLPNQIGRLAGKGKSQNQRLEFFGCKMFLPDPDVLEESFSFHFVTQDFTRQGPGMYSPYSQIPTPFFELR